MQRLIFIYHLGVGGGAPSGSGAAGSGDIKRRRSIKLTRPNLPPGTSSKKNKTTHKHDDSVGNLNSPASKTSVYGSTAPPTVKRGELPLTHTAEELRVNPNDSMQESNEFLWPGWAAITVSKTAGEGSLMAPLAEKKGKAAA